MMRRGPAGPRTLCNACGLKWANKVLILQDSVEEKDDEITRLKQELQHRSIVEEEKTEVASDKKDGDIDGGMLCPEAETEITKHKASTVVNEIKEYLDFHLYFLEIVEPLGRQVQELPYSSSEPSGFMGLQQLKHKRAVVQISEPWEEIAADKSFEEAGFAAALAAERRPE
ncbi:GATA transcription factor 28 [Camellia lanceoleosa]|uniref:GATA transcription factor 28 n=1 Tax=Camellia lanceoleosa TaxID=1840588 RepID=A0ACC0FUU6_9ERIC|nr:GATA transcription factor 28 [Camellia lanceoleosa]